MHFTYAGLMTQVSQNPEIHAFLERNHVAVLATAGKDAKPHAATIYFAIDPNLNFYFVTKNKTTKSKNLDSNPQAALAVYEQDTQRTAQIAGAVKRVEDKAMLDQALDIMKKIAAKTGGASEIPITKLDAGEFILYQLVPEFIRLGDYKYGVHNELFKVALPAEESLE